MFARRLAELRKAKGLKQKNLAELINISRDTYAQYEIGRRSPEYETLIKIANFHGVTVDYLVGNDTISKEMDAEIAILWERIKEKGMAAQVKRILRHCASDNVTVEHLKVVESMLDIMESDKKA